MYGVSTFAYVSMVSLDKYNSPIECFGFQYGSSIPQFQLRSLKTAQDFAEFLRWCDGHELEVGC